MSMHVFTGPVATRLREAAARIVLEPTVQPPQNHVDMADKVKAYYPWKDLRKKFVFLGSERQAPDQPAYPQTTWLWLYDDGTDVDVAAVMVIYELADHYTLTFSRQDAGDGEQLTVEINGQVFPNIFTAPDTLPGMTAIDIAK
jgi:hypothetical protein